MFKVLSRLIFSAFLLLILSCYAQASGIQKFNTKDFKIGVWRDSSFVSLARKKLPNATLVFFKERNEDLIDGLVNNKIDGFIADNVTAKDIVKTHPNLQIDDAVLDRTLFAMAFNKNNHKLRDEFAKEIKKMKADGSLQKLHSNWFSDDSLLKITTLPPVGKRGRLKVATAGINSPFSFFANNKLVGIEIELVNTIATKLGYTVEWVLLDHKSFIDQLKSNNVDIYASLLTITEERSKYVLFGEPDFEDNVVMIIKKHK